MPPVQPLPPKKEVALALLERSNDRGIYVHLDPRRAGVAVPPWFKKQPQLVLQIGLNMAIPIPDLRLDDDGMSCTLSFNRSPFFCVVPWTSVFAIVGDDAKGMVWPDDVPAEIARQTQMRAVESPPRKEAGPPESKPETTKAKRSKKRPPLAAVEDGESPEASSRPARPAAVPAPAPSSPAVPPASPSRPAAAGAAPGKKKRELPPYLRVVK